MINIQKQLLLLCTPHSIKDGAAFETCSTGNTFLCVCFNSSTL